MRMKCSGMEQCKDGYIGEDHVMLKWVILNNDGKIFHSQRRPKGIS